MKSEKQIRAEATKLRQEFANLQRTHHEFVAQVQKTHAETRDKASNLKGRIQALEGLLPAPKQEKK